VGARSDRIVRATLRLLKLPSLFSRPPAAAQEATPSGMADLASHPVVGGWRITVDLGGGITSPDLQIFHADGTYTEVLPTGDVLVAVDGCSGPARARIVFEAKNAYVPKNKAVAELDAAMEQRDADYGVWVVPSAELLPGHGAQLREVNGDKLFVVHDPEDGSRLGLEVAYALARARTLMAKSEGDELDAGALRTEVERALAAMDDVRRIKTQLTAATGGIDAARRILDEMAERVRGHLEQVDALVVAGTGDETPPQRTLV